MNNTFDLIETMLWEKNNYFLLPLHLSRLEKSSQYFSFVYDKVIILKSLESYSKNFEISENYKVRLILKKNGQIELSSEMINKEPLRSPVKIAVSSILMDKTNIFLYHKTTNRSIYNKELARYKKTGVFEVVFLNKNNEVTEGATSNIIIQKKENFFTPPEHCGLLPGVFREYLLQKNNFPLKEKVLTKEELLNCNKIFVINSVRKIMEATLTT